MADPTAHNDAIAEQYALDKMASLNLPISNAEVMYRGGFCCLDLATGSVEYSANDASHRAVGIYIGSPLGRQEAADRTGVAGLTVRGQYRAGIVLENVSVTGVSAVTDVGDIVYATDGSTLNITAAGSESPFGMIVRWRATTYCDVYLFTLAEAVNYVDTV